MDSSGIASLIMRSWPGFITPAHLTEFENTWTSLPGGWADAGTGATPNFQVDGMHCVTGEHIFLFTTIPTHTIHAGTVIQALNVTSYTPATADSGFLFTGSTTAGATNFLGNNSGNTTSTNAYLDGSITLSSPNGSLTAGMLVTAVTWSANTGAAKAYQLLPGGAIVTNTFSYTTANADTQYLTQEMTRPSGADSAALYKTYHAPNLFRSQDWIVRKATSWGWT